MCGVRACVRVCVLVSRTFLCTRAVCAGPCVYVRASFYLVAAEHVVVGHENGLLRRPQRIEWKLALRTRADGRVKERSSGRVISLRGCDSGVASRATRQCELPSGGRAPHQDGGFENNRGRSHRQAG